MAPKLLRTVAEARAFTQERTRLGKRLALVPTMGFLHPGHLSLMEEARRCGDVVAASIFVNPTQFGPKEDLASYPRDLEGDLAKCEAAGVDTVFAPAAQEMYPQGHQTFVQVTQLERGLCGDRRPGHFRGVATVVAQLFALLRPEVAVFGEKDYQQLLLLRALSRDLHFGVEVVGRPIVREPSGLALSSRNSYLSAPEKEQALSLSKGLFAAQRLFEAGVGEKAPLEGAVREQLARAGVREDYVQLVDADTLVDLSRIEAGGRARLLVAAFVGNTRLIDNAPLGR